MRVVLIPSSVFLAAIFGGGYGSGREVAEFVSRHGPVGGLMSLAVIGVVFVACLFLCFEIARLCRAYEYHGFARVLLGRAGPLYETVVIVGLLLALAINATASGTLVAGHFGFPPATATAAFLACVVALTFFGRRVVESMMIASCALLAVALLYLSMIVATEHRDSVVAAFSVAGWEAAGLRAGFQVALANCGLLPLLLFCSRGLETRREVAVAAGFAGVAGILPAVVLHLSFMTAYPRILAFELPAYQLIGEIAPALFFHLYVGVLFVLMIQTGVAVLFGMLQSLNALSLTHRSRPMSRLERGAFAAAALVASLLLASIGLIELVVRSYGFLFAAFLLVFYLPLLGRGVPLVFRGNAS